MFFEGNENEMWGSETAPGLEKVIFKRRCNIRLGHTICNIEMELVAAMKNDICVVPADYTFFDGEWKVNQSRTSNAIL